MPNLRSILVRTLLCGGALVVAPHEHAHACSVPAPLPIEVVASSEPSGPIVFILRCGITCTDLSSLQVKEGQSGAEVKGTFATKTLSGSPDRLVLFTPNAPLATNASHVLWDGNPGRPAPSFWIVATGAPAALDRAEVRDGTRTYGTGRFYQCVLGLIPNCGGAPRERRLSWNELGFLRSSISVAVRASDGWLFHTGDSHWVRSLEAAVDLSPGVEGCIELQAWNVLTDARESRRICKSGPLLSDAQQNITTPTPNLGECREPPTLGHEMASAPLFLDTWCRDRSAYCATHTSGPDACGGPDPRCAKAAPSADASRHDEQDDDAAEDDDASVAATYAPVQPPRAEENAFGSDVPEASDGGCSLVRAGSRAGSLALLGLLSALGLAGRRVSARVGEP